MLDPDDRVLVAVSGGPDSMVLLQVLWECASSYCIEIEVAHFNHRLRAAESDRDQALVQERCLRLGLTCHVEQATRATVTSNIEETARTDRYRFLFRKAKERGCNRIATGHTLDDQAETVLMRLIRGSGVDGLAGIRAVRADGVIRPLIDCERHQVLAYLNDRGMGYADDHTNSDRRLLRNRMRHEILPSIRLLNPGLNRTLAQTARLAAADADLLERLSTAAAQERTASDGTMVLEAIDDLPEGLLGRALRIWLGKRRGSLRGIGSIHLDALMRLAKADGPSRRVELPGNGVVIREYGTLRFQSLAATAEQAFRHQLLDGSSFELRRGWQVEAVLRSGRQKLPHTERSLWHFWADADIVGRGLTLRNAMPGDRIQPLGLVGGHRKLQDVFVDAKLPRDQRWTRPVLETGEHILWVPGLVRSQHGLISPETRTAWRVVIAAAAVAGQ